MSEKKLKISLELDDKAFVAGMKRVQDQLNKMQTGFSQKVNQYMQSQGITGSAGSNPREQEQAHRKMGQEYEKSFRDAKQKVESLTRLQKLFNEEKQRGITDSKRALEVEQKLAALKEKETRIVREQRLQADRERAKDVAGGGRGAPGGSPDILSTIKTTLGVLGVGFGAAALVNLAKQYYTSSVSAPAQINLANGSAVQSSVGYLNQGILSKDIASQTLLQNQIAKGKDLAEKNFDAQISNKISKFIAYSFDSIEQNFGQQDPNKAIDTRKNAYEAKRASQIGSDTIEQAQKSVAQDNSLVLANDYFSQTFGRNLGSERNLGLSSDKFKRLQLQLNNSGFTTDQGTGILDQIQQAGGSASGDNAGSLAKLGLGAQRGLNLTNAGSVLGKLSGLSGSNNIGQTDETFKRVLEEAIRKGFNKSENTEILRKFTESTAGIIYRGEATKGEDVDRLSRGFSQLLTGDNPTSKQFEAAQGAYEKYQSATSETSGRGGALGFAAFAGNKGFSNLNSLKIGKLLALRPDQTVPTNTTIIAAAAEQGTTPEKLVDSILDAKEQQGLSEAGLSKEGLAPLKKYLGGRSLESLARNTKEVNELKKKNPAAYRAYQTLDDRGDLYTGTAASNQEGIAQQQQYLSGIPRSGQLGDTSRSTTAITTGTGGKKEEEYIAAQAAQEKQLTLNLKYLEDQLYPTAKGIENLTKYIIGLGDAAKLLTDQERAAGVFRATPTQQVDTRATGKTPANGSKTRPGQ
jgi:hypothetical protein